MSSDIDVHAMSEALNDKMDRDGNNAYPPLTRVIKSWVDPDQPTEGYRIWSHDGIGYYCEQWGRYIIQTNGVGTITFIKTFANTNYDIYACKTSSDRSTWTIMFDPIDAWTPTSITIKSNLTNYVLSGSWRACGYLAEGEY